MDESASRASVAYVTDLAQTPSGGGAYAVNFNAFAELAKRFDVQYAGPIIPRVPPLEAIVSKVRRRILGLPGKYAYFSGSTLDRNARDVDARVQSRADAIVFRSAGRWCRFRPQVPYFVYLDAVVHTFFQNTFHESDFDSQDLARIWGEERRFLEAASGVFFESEWGLQKAVDAYGLEGEHYCAVGRGGVIDPPEQDAWNGESRSLVTMAMNFRQKGGDLVAQAFRRLKPRHPSLTWDIIGGEAGHEVESMDGVTHHGMLRPDNPAERAELERILARAFLCVHPTREDTSPLVLTEAGYFGCPSISVDAFAIPELVLNGRTGILLPAPVMVDDLAQAIESLLIDNEKYLAMRSAARQHSISAFRWDRTGALMCDHIERVIAA